jgi:hypothetical protein
MEETIAEIWYLQFKKYKLSIVFTMLDHNNFLEIFEYPFLKIKWKVAKYLPLSSFQHFYTMFPINRRINFTLPKINEFILETR